MGEVIRCASSGSARARGATAAALRARSSLCASITCSSGVRISHSRLAGLGNLHQHAFSRWGCGPGTCIWPPWHWRVRHAASADALQHPHTVPESCLTCRPVPCQQGCPTGPASGTSEDAGTRRPLCRPCTRSVSPRLAAR